MTMTAPALRAPGSPARLLRAAWQVSPAITLMTLLGAATLVVAVAGRILDPTVINGAPAWDKPAKFALSFLAFGPAMLWLFAHVQRTRTIRVGLEVIGWALFVELALITMQATRGVASHFNYTTALDGAVFSAMAAGVGIFSVAAVLVGLVLARRNLGPGPLALAFKTAIPIMTVGSVLAFSMTGPRPGQIKAGASTIGGHAVGGPDGGPGLPLLGWSTEFGDVRVAHFIGLHALQVLPLVALLLVWLVRRGTLRLDDRGQRRVVAWSAAAYAGLVAVTFVQAQRGQPVTGPDLVTLSLAAVLVGVPALAALLTALRPSRRDDDMAEHPHPTAPNLYSPTGQPAPGHPEPTTPDRQLRTCTPRPGNPHPATRTDSPSRPGPGNRDGSPLRSEQEPGRARWKRSSSTEPTRGTDT